VLYFNNSVLNSAALAALNGREVLGSELKVTWNVQAAGPKEDTSGHSTVFVGNIGDSIDEYTLFESFSQYNCSDSRIIRGEDGRCLGYGFVTIRTQEDAQAAVTAMDGQRLMGRPLRVSFAKTPRLSETTGTAAPDPTTSKSRPPDNTTPLDPTVVATQASDTNCTVHVGNLLGEVALDEKFMRCMRRIGSFGLHPSRRERA
jgi:RNA recognition motif-containing protein